MSWRILIEAGGTSGSGTWKCLLSLLRKPNGETGAEDAKTASTARIETETTSLEKDVQELPWGATPISSSWLLPSNSKITPL